VSDPAAPSTDLTPAPLDELSALRARVEELEHALARHAAIEDELRARAGTYLGYLEQSGDSIFTLNAAGRYLYANSAFADGVGLPLAAIVGKTQWDVFPKDEADLRFAALYRAYGQAGAYMLATPAAFTRMTGEAH